MYLSHVHASNCHLSNKRIDCIFDICNKNVFSIGSETIQYDIVKRAECIYIFITKNTKARQIPKHLVVIC